MIGINQIASYIPREYDSNFDRKTEFEIDDAFIKNKIGVYRVSRKAEAEETSDMCVKAFRVLQTKTLIPIENVDAIIVCTQNPDGNGIPHTSATVHAKLEGPEDCAAFDIALGCSGYVYALSIAKGFMEANGMKTGLLFTADPYSKIINPADKNTTLLFGDAATVTLLSDSPANNSALWHPTRFLFGTHSKSGLALHNSNGRLEMNGRAIYTFAATAVPAQVKKLLRSVNLGPEAIDLFLFHQGSKYIIDTLCKRMCLPSDKVPNNLQTQGNTVSSSIPLLFEHYLHRGDLNKIVLSGFGVGLSLASCILEKNQKGD